MPEPEKITINVSPVDLGKIDLLVQESLYSNRTDFIRTAIRSLLDRHSVEIQQSVTRRSSVVGALIFNQSDMLNYQQKGETLKLKVVGYLNLTSDIDPALARQVIESVEVHGVFHASAEVKEALRDRML